MTHDPLYGGGAPMFFEDFEDDDFYDHEDGSCYWCGGDGWDECDDPIECTNEHRVVVVDGEWVGQLCRCSSCGGTGQAKDMTIW